ncbi:MAG: ATP-binding domain-containing protein [Clostridia bacterium]|nr:ATP-binding domain-containing protein [Clostridia bacterium]
MSMLIALQCIKHNGSEFDVVIMPIIQAAPVLLTRTLLYTAMTRAKKLLILVGSPNVVEFMIQNADSKKRNTGLEFKLKTLTQ